MGRTLKSAKNAGTRMERETAQYLATMLADDRIERRAKTGAKDRGDISGVRTPTGDRVVIECKNTTRHDLAGWAKEAAIEAANDDAYVWAVVHKRHGVGDPAQQWVTMTLEQFARLLGA